MRDNNFPSLMHGILTYMLHRRSQFAKTKIDAGADNEKKDDSGNETGAGEGEPEEEPEIVHYDKSKSFFDNISCEAVERSKGCVSVNNSGYNYLTIKIFDMTMG